MNLKRKKITLLSREEMQNLLGGNTPSEGGMGSGDCNKFCETGNDCKSVCKSCEDIPNWGPFRSCVHGLSGGSDTGSDFE